MIINDKNNNEAEKKNELRSDSMIKTDQQNNQNLDKPPQPQT